jgi:hypothetical protein
VEISRKAWWKNASCFLSILVAKKLYRIIRSNYPNGQWDYKFCDFKTKEDKLAKLEPTLANS